MRFITLCLTLVSLFFTVSLFAKEVTLREKIGQMLMIGFQEAEITPDSPIVKIITQQRIGGVILYDVDYKGGEHNIKNPEQVKQLTQNLQFYTKAAAKNNTNDLYPLFIGIDYEGGKVNRLKEKYGFPKTLSAAAAAKLPQGSLFEYADQMATTLKENGINFNFAPVVDVNVNPDSPIIGKLERSFSSDPARVREVASIFGRAFHQQRIICSYKHFPGHGSATGDTHKGFVDTTYTWKELELIPYEGLSIDANNCPVVMTAHVMNYNLDSKGFPATLSKPILKDLLRDKLQFTGVIITDDMQMKAITDKFGLREAIRLSINAGADILMFANQLEHPQDPTALINFIYDDVKSGKISESRIDDAYQRIMKLKVFLRNGSN